MNADAFVVLEAIGCGARVDGRDSLRWIEAFKTIRWVVEGRDGPVLTEEGRRARDQMALERRSITPAKSAPARRAAAG